MESCPQMDADVRRFGALNESACAFLRRNFDFAVFADMRMSVRRASFTAIESGNIAATSGASTTTFVPSERSAPRTCREGRRKSRSDLAFRRPALIYLPYFRRSRADDARILKSDSYTLLPTPGVGGGDVGSVILRLPEPPLVLEPFALQEVAA
jgi:hypothetical protein